MKFICPKCGGVLTEVDATLKCELGHSYDRSREGYYNLLLGAGAGVHGDNKEMLLARRAFLNTGAYFPLAGRIAELCQRYTEEGSYLLDAGCGEGYYTSIIKEALPSSAVYAFDISKDAAKMTAKKNKNIRVAVASSYSMPFADGSFDTVVNVFSPLAIEETSRVMKSGGKFIMALPNKRHLFGLKAKIYENPYENEPLDTALSRFRLIHSEEISYEKEFKTRDEVSALFMMTPYAYRTKKEERERALMLDYVKTEIEFIILVYEKI